MFTASSSRRSWAIRAVSSLFSRQRSATPSERRRRRSAAVEELEDRALLATFTVTSTANLGPGTLRDAVGQANATAAFDNIVFDLPLSRNITLDTEILIGEDVLIDGMELSTGESVVVSGGNTSRIFDVDGVTNGADVQIQNLIMTNGGGLTHDPMDEFVGSGGAIRVDFGSLTVRDSTLSGNSAATHGGAIFNRNGAVTIASTSILNNSAAGSGGGIRTRFGSVVIQDSVIDGNTAVFNGGGVRSGSGLRIERSTINGNSAGQGGGAYTNSGFISADSTWSANTAVDGGGIYNTSFAEVRNSTFSGNIATRTSPISFDGQGGGIFNRDFISITNSTLTQNEAAVTNSGVSGRGGGIYTFTGGGGSGPGQTLLFNTIIAGNTRADGTPDDLRGTGSDGRSQNNIVGDPNSAGALLDGVQGNIVGDMGGVIDTDTVIDPNLANNVGPTQTHALVPKSIGVDAGDNNRAAQAGPNFVPDILGDDDIPLDNDQRGSDPFVRIYDDIVDIGAYEVQPFIVDLIGDESDGDYTAGDLSLREAIEIANFSANEDSIAFGIQGVFDPVLEIDAQLYINTPVTILGRNNGGGGFATIDGDADGRVFWIDGVTPAEIPTVIFEDLTIVNGHANGTDEDAFPTLGGAILNEGAKLELFNAGLHGNSADGSGGGIANIAGGVLTTVNTTISGSVASSQGGGVYNELSQYTAVNSTITGNTAGLVGGGVLATNDAVTETRVYNSIIAGNTGFGVGQDLSGKPVEPGAAHNLIGSASNAGGIAHGVMGNVVGNAGLGTIDVSTVLDTTAAKNGGASPTHALIAGSLALDAGDNNLAARPGDNLIPDVAGDLDEALVNDSRNNPFTRTFNGTTDIGAYEDQVLNILVDNPVDELDADFTDLDFSLREAALLVNQNPGVDSIGFEDLGPDPTVDVEGQLVISSDVVIDGATIDGNVTLDGDGSQRIFLIDGSTTSVTTSMSNLNFINGRADGVDGGLSPLSGGAILVRLATLDLDHTVFTNNRADDSGGAIYVEDGFLSVTDSTFADNTAAILGGALANDDGAVDILTSTFSANTAEANGGAIFNNNGPMSIVNSTVSGNSANIDAGGIYNEDDTVVLVNTTVVHNIADADGNGTGEAGGLLTVNDGVTFTNLFNTLIAGNTLGTGADSDLAGKTPEAISSNNLVGDAGSSAGLVDGVNGNIVGVGGVGTIPVDSILLPGLVSNGGPVQTHELVPFSPAINAGDTNRAAIPGANLIPDIAGDTDVALVQDQRGFPYDRLSGGFVDIGSYEVISTWIVDTDTDIDDGDYTAGNLSLREAVFLANSTPAAVTIQFDIPVASPTIPVGEELFIDTNVVMDGTNLNALGGTVTLDGGGAGRILKIDGDITPVQVGLTNLTFMGGNADGSNTAPFNLEGGAIFGLTANIDISNSTFIGNAATEGGAILTRTGTLNIDDTTFTSNVAGNGGALLSFGTQTTITESRFTMNDATFTGGGLLVRAGTTSVIASTIWNNTATDGAGAANESSGNLYATNSTVSGNRTINNGAGVHNSSGVTVLTNTTVTGNLGDEDADGGGLGGGVWTSAAADTRMFNTIVAGNEIGDPINLGLTIPNDAHGLIGTNSNNLIGDALSSGGLIDGTDSNIVGNSGVGTIDINTVLNPALAVNGGSLTMTHALAPGSPAIDAGNTNRAALPGANGLPDVSADGDVGLVFDQRQTPYLRATGNADIGSYEVTNGWVVSTSGDIADGVFGIGEFSLREAVETANLNPGTDTITFDIGLSRTSIVLDGTELTVTDNLVIDGLGAGSITIDAAGLSRVMNVNAGANVTVRHATLTGGASAGAGGAITSQGTLTLEDVALTGNSANNGGALMIGGPTTIKRSLFTGNTAVYGGAIDSDSTQAAAYLENVTVSGNTATGVSGTNAGAGIHASDTIFTIVSSTIANNTSTANGEGAGIAVDLTPGTSGSVALINSIVADNVTAGVGVDVAGHLDRLHYSLIEVDLGYTRSNEIGSRFGDPGLEPLAVSNGQTATHELSLDSIALNFGDDTEVTFATDQTGQPRLSGTVDMGAKERLLLAVDDTGDTPNTNAITIDVLNNDNPSSNVEVRRIVSGPTEGLGDVTIDPGGITYTPNGSGTGFDTFVYEMGIQTQTEGGAIDSEFGHSVAVDGDWMVVGAQSDDAQTPDGGGASVYRRSGSAWLLHEQLDALDEEAVDRFGYDVAIEGSTIVVGARMDDEMGRNAGAAYVYEFDAAQGSWRFSQKLLDTVTGSTKDQFGHSVAIEGDTIVVGARLDDGLGQNGGSIFIFNRSATGWTTTGAVKNLDQVKGDQFGYDVDIDGDTIAVGARKDNTGGVDSGSVYIFENIGGTWTETKEILSTTTRRNTWFGYSVSLSGDTVAVGMPQRFSRFRAGEVHVLERDQGGADNWGETALITDPGVDPETDHFGFAVAIDDDNLAIGSRRDDTVANNAGMVYLHQRDVGGPEAWGLSTPVPAADGMQNDSYGRSVALDGNTFVIGASLADPNGPLSGSIYIHDFRADTADVTVTVRSPLQATTIGTNSTTDLTTDQLAPIVSAATAYWQNINLTAAQQTALDSVTVTISALDGAFLGLAGPNSILIDTDGAGHGWFIDANPLALGSLQPGNRVDLFTTVLHELGHVIGLNDTYDAADADNIMYGYLAAGERRLELAAPSDSDLDVVFGQIAEDDDLFAF